MHEGNSEAGIYHVRQGSEHSSPSLHSPAIQSSGYENEHLNEAVLAAHSHSPMPMVSSAYVGGGTASGSLINSNISLLGGGNSVLNKFLSHPHAGMVGGGSASMEDCTSHSPIEPASMWSYDYKWIVSGLRIKPDRLRPDSRQLGQVGQRRMDGRSMWRYHRTV